MRRTLSIITTLAVLTTAAIAQDHDHQHTEKCGTMPHLEMLKQADPGLEDRMEELERKTAQWIQSNQNKLKSTDNVITIPVVVHVVYANATQNVSDEQIYSQLDVLNKDFRRLNSDTANTPQVWKSVAADPGIEFCLASRDPQGNFTTGITRTFTTNTNFTTFNNSVKYDVTGGKSAWPADEYLNMWVCNIQGTVLGYAQFPGGNPATDGVVIDYQAFGTTGTAQQPYNLGRTTTHEIGHWLNLRHIWGDDGGACTGSDYVNDTPNQGSEYYGCPSFPKTSCGTQDMFMNYMDYVNDNCSNLFTAGQKQRMLAALNIWRAGLLSSPGCVTQLPEAQFAVDASLTAPGCAVNFTDQSIGAVQTYFWSFEGGNPSVSTIANPGAVSYTQTGQWDVTLVVSNVMGSDTLYLPDYITVSDTLRPEPDFMVDQRFVCSTDIIQLQDNSTTCPTAWNWSFQPNTVTYHNGTDQNSETPQVSFDAPGEYTINLDVTNVNGTRSIQKDNIVLSGGLEVPFGEFFDGGSFDVYEWETVNPDGDFSWEVVAAPAEQADNKAAVLPIHGTNSLGHRDRLISAPIDLAGLTEAYLMFEHAYAQYQAGFSDSLIVLISDDCGASWTRVFAAGEDGNGSFATHPLTTANFVPSGESDWCDGSSGTPCNAVDISAWAGMNNIKIAFEGFSFISNNIYVDDIRISSVLSRDPGEKKDAVLQIFPNPNDGTFTIKYENLQGNFVLRVNNLQGQTVYEDDIKLTNENYLGLDLPDIRAGVYLMNLVGDSQVVTRKLILR